jgi:hypothetical protein
MALSHKDGPLVVTGNLNPQQLSDWEEGPSTFADGTAVMDPRWAYQVTGSFSGNARSVYALPTTNALMAVDFFPQTLATNNVVASQGAGQAAGFSATLATGTVQSAVSNVPVVPWAKVAGGDIYGNTLWAPQSFATQNLVTAGLCLDFGCAAGTTFTSTTVTLSALLGPGMGTYPAQFAGLTVNKNQIVVLQTTNHIQPELMFVPGQNIIIANAGNAGGTIPLVTTVLAVDYVNHYLYIANPALSAQSNAGIAFANLYGSQPGLAYWPYLGAGAINLQDPRHMGSRALQYLSSSASDTTVTLTAAGYDVFGIPMTETITLNGTTPVLGKKAFKFVNSVKTGVASLVGNITVGTQDVVGLTYRSDTFSYLTLFYTDAGVTANTGFTKADITSPATAVTGDVRGTYALQSASNGAKRVAIWIDPASCNWDIESNLTPFSVFGTAQF